MDALAVLIPLVSFIAAALIGIGQLSGILNGEASLVCWVAAFCNPTFCAPLCWVNEKAVHPTYNWLPRI